jgi:glycosyltransferase involved in cell wall biosynthesis
VLDSLKAQTLLRTQWELLLIDNASIKSIASLWDLTWHPRGRHIHEKELGLTPARLRGIREAVGEMLIFVDDDNILDPNYLETAISISKDYPWVGAFNGSTIGEFEHEPPEWSRFMLIQLAVRTVNAVSWACEPGTGALRCAPCGAGMVIQRRVALAYLNRIEHDPLRKSLDRSGSSLGAAGDSDMAFCSCEMGLAVGLFPELTLKHLIPPNRLERDYLIRLAEGMSRSHTILRYIWDPEFRNMPESLAPGLERRVLRAYKTCRVWLIGTPTERFRAKIQTAALRGEMGAREMLINSGIGTRSSQQAA